MIQLPVIPNIVPPVPPLVNRPVSPVPVSLPSLAFTTCSTDAVEISKLPRTTIDLSDPSGKASRQLTESRAKWFSGAPRPSAGNAVVGYTYGRCAFDDIGDALATAHSSDHRIYLSDGE